MNRLFCALIVGSMLLSCTFNIGNNNSIIPVSESDETTVVIDNIMARRSIRKYKNQTVGRDTLDTILKCGINAPNGMNQQNYEIKVVDDATSAAYLAECVSGLYKAPVYIFIAAGNSYDMSLIDCGLLSENICLAAKAYGLGTVNLGMPVRSIKENPELLARFGFSEGYDLCLVLALGYPDESPEARPRKVEKIQFVTISE